MRALPGVLAGTVVFEPGSAEDRSGDAGPGRDAMTRTFDAELAAAVGVDSRRLVQDHRIRLERGAVHGLTLRTDGGEGVLVSCCSGSVLFVAVDLRPGSGTYRAWMTVVLDDVDDRSVWLPPGLANGYQALSGSATVCCRVNRVRQPWRETVIAPDDPDLAIPWPLPLPAPRVPGDTPRASELAIVEPFLSDWFGSLG